MYSSHNLFAFITYIVTMTQHKQKRKESSSSYQPHDDVYEQNKMLCAVITALIALIGMCACYLIWLDTFIARFKTTSDSAKNRRVNERRTWDKEEKRFSRKMFFRLFRMKRSTFQKLCHRIECNVGDESFKSESYISKLKREGNVTEKGRIMNAARTNTGEYISGEWKVAMSLRLMAGATYLDMYLWANVSPDYVMRIFRHTNQYWFAQDFVSPMNYFDNILRNKEGRDKVRERFGDTSDGIMFGVVGAVDGWLVRIICPLMTEVPNPGKYMSRKGFYAINVQAIVDKDKRILW